MPISDRILVDRTLTHAERELVGWLLDHATATGTAARGQLKFIRVAARCGCGCGSIDFRSVRAAGSQLVGGVETVADFWWRTPFGNLCGASIFLLAGHLKGLDVWSIDGNEYHAHLPQPYELWAFPADQESSLTADTDRRLGGQWRSRSTIMEHDANVPGYRGGHEDWIHRSRQYGRCNRG